MTGREAIEWADELSPNQYSVEQKLAWLSDHDGRVWREVLVCYVDGDTPEPYVDGKEILLIPDPYARGVYGNFLCAKSAEANREFAAYNQYTIAFNDALRAWADSYNREHRAKSGGSWVF